MHRRIVFLALVVFAAQWLSFGCTGGDGGGSGGGGGGGGIVTPTPAPTPEPPGTTVTTVIGQPGLCAAGDVARMEIGTDRSNRFPLVTPSVTCTPAKDNRREEYTLILYNTTAGASTFRIDSPIETAPPTTLLRKAESRELLPPAPLKAYDTGPNQMEFAASQLRHTLPKQYGRGSRALQPGSVFGLTTGEEAEFRIRCDSSNPDVFCTTSAILRGQGAHINIFVDRDIPFNQAGNPDSLTTTQMTDAVTIFENNTYPLATGLLGSESDIDGDGRVSVLISPIVNRYLIIDTEPVASYTDPRNLLPFDSTANPGSNEQEIIFVFAPDSLGNYGSPNGSIGVSAANYVDRTLNGWIAFQLSKLINYNQKILINDTDAEDDWISDGIGAVIADLAGFNIWHESVQRFLSRPQLDDVREIDDLDGELGQGAEYMFMLYYMQSQVDSTSEDANGDNIDDDLGILTTLTQSLEVSFENLEAAVDYDFDATLETEFQSIFKDWTIALLTSGTYNSDLQNSSQTVLEYFFGVNPSAEYGSAICNGAGSTRTGATGNNVGIDLNDFTDGLTPVLIENTDEHTWTPGNEFFGYVSPFSAMYVRLGGLFQSTQTVEVKVSTSSLQGFIVRRTDISYPTTYAESMFGSIDQHQEFLDDGTAAGSTGLAEGPNPYWTNQGISKRLDYYASFSDSLFTPKGVGRPLTVVGRIDTADKVQVCPSDPTGCDGPNTEVPDTDKYEIVVPAGGTNLAVSVRRQFDEGSDNSALSVMAALVSSKDVPYPYLPNPTRGGLTCGGGDDCRPQYRWMTPTIICGQGDSGESTDDVAPNGTCAVPTGLTGPQSRFIYSGLIEATTTLEVNSGMWNGDIKGNDCAGIPTFKVNRPGSNGNPGITAMETSPSYMGYYGWYDFATGEVPSFFGGTILPYPIKFPDVLFAREVINPTSGYPSVEPTAPYDPRAINGLTLNCWLGDTSGTTTDTTPDSPDDVLAPGELSQGGSLATQVLIEMTRDRSQDNYAGNKVIYNEDAVLVIDRDSRDSDTTCTRYDLGNNMNTATVSAGEGALIITGNDFLMPHIRDQISGSEFPYTSTAIGSDANQAIYDTSGALSLTLEAGKSYTLIVGGTGGSTGNYEVKFRHITPGNTALGHEALTGSSKDCKEPTVE